MTKAEMVDAVAKGAGITKKAAQTALEALIDLITADLKKGNNVVLTGFGTFRVSKRNARWGGGKARVNGHRRQGIRFTRSFLREHLPDEEREFRVIDELDTAAGSEIHCQWTKARRRYENPRAAPEICMLPTNCWISGEPTHFSAP